MFMSTQYSYVEVLMPNMMALGGGCFGNECATLTKG